jgi:monoamine oxidase
MRDNVPNTMQQEFKTDIVIVGAGIAGVSVARQVRRAGLDAILLEASSRVGGRLKTHRLSDGSTFELGGQWISNAADMPRIHALIEEFDMTVFDQRDAGRLDMTTQPMTALDKLTQTEWAWFKAKLADLAEDINVANPSRSPNAMKLDAISVEEWKRRNLESPLLRHIFDQVVRTEYTVEPKDFSFLHFLSTLKMNGGLEAMFESSHSLRLAEGFETLVERMAAELGDALKLNCQVYDVYHDDDGVRIVAENLTVTAQRVVLALPPNQAQRIDFEPMLPRSRMLVIQRMEMGSVIKCFALYDKPFWRGRPTHAIDPDELIFDHTLDASSYGDKHPALVAFIGGSDAVYWSDQTPEARKRAVLEGLSRVFGSEALYPKLYFDHDWMTEPYIGGGYNCYAPPGVITAGYEKIDEPIGRIHFAGTEMAEHYEGYIEGALESADRAAKEVIAAFSQDDGDL